MGFPSQFGGEWDSEGGFPGEKTRGREARGAEKVTVSAEGQLQPGPAGPPGSLPPWDQPFAPPVALLWSLRWGGGGVNSL